MFEGRGVRRKHVRLRFGPGFFFPPKAWSGRLVSSTQVYALEQISSIAELLPKNDKYNGQILPSDPNLGIVFVTVKRGIL